MLEEGIVKTFPVLSIAWTDNNISLNSVPKQPEFILMPPPILPGIQDKNSKPPMLFSDANSATFLSIVALPAIIVLFFNTEILEKFFPNLTITPSNPLSFIRIFEPTPSIKIFSLFPKFLKKTTKSFKFSGLKKAFAFPPILNQFVFLKS